MSRHFFAMAIATASISIFTLSGCGSKSEESNRAAEQKTFAGHRGTPEEIAKARDLAMQHAPKGYTAPPAGSPN